MKFNRINKIALAFLGASLLFSCEDNRLDLMPEIDTPMEGGISTVEDLQKVLNNAYGTIGSNNAMGGNALIYAELMSDNAFVSNANDGYYTGVNGMSWTDTSGDVSTIWASYYGAVRDANLVINANLGTLEGTPEVMTIKSQAHIIRGLAYFYLLQYFSPSPAVSPNSEFGIIINNLPYNPNTLLQRSTVAESFAAVISDLQTGLASAPETAADKYTFTKTTANFILSKVYLYMGDNNSALTYADAVINNSPAAYGFIDAADYVDYFSNADNVAFQENKPETIWEYPQTVLFNFSVNAHMGVFFAANGQHKSILYRQTFKDSFAGADVRVGLFGGQGSANDTPRGLYIKKWQRSNGEGPFTQDIKIFRMTEAKFIRWEAMAKSGNGAGALAELNAFAASRGGNTYAGTDIIGDILTEKKKEFFGEGTRFYDLKRNALPIVKESNCISNCTVEATDKLFVFPIPFGEINLNPSVVQNPGW